MGERTESTLKIQEDLASNTETTPSPQKSVKASAGKSLNSRLAANAKTVVVPTSQFQINFADQRGTTAQRTQHLTKDIIRARDDLVTPSQQPKQDE